ncbi:MAG: TIM-barrel domain-containing protein [Phycisphaerae bacterium]
MPLPPRWALGAHQTRLGWNSADHLLETAKSLSARGLGCDVFYFDLPSQDGYRVFTWNTERFSEPRQVTEALKAVGAHTMLVVQAGFKEDAADPLYMQGGQLDAWVTRVNGMPFVGQTESGLTVYPDFTSDAVSGWWQELLAAFLVDAGVEGVWFDRNQPVVLGGPDGTLPPDLKVKSWGLQADLVTCHNVYAASAAQSAYEGVRRAWPDGRALVLATSSFAGGQRYAGSAAAVVVKSWADLRSSLSNVLNLGLSGISLVGTGIDTRSKDMSGELYARWLQLNSLLPIGRAHTAWADSQTGDWARSKSLDGVAKRALQLRYSLMPYLYTLLEESSRIGLPLARPVWMEFPGAGDVDAEQGFMLGESLYVVPVMQAGAQRLTLRLPPGSWYSMGSGRRFQGGQEVTLPVTLDNLPVFVRGGAIIPMQSPTGTLAEHPSEPLILAVWPDGSSKASLYEDDGATPAHDQGQFRRTALTCKASGRSIEVTLGAAKGQFVAAGRSPLVRVYGLTGRVGQVTCLSGKAVHGSDTHAARSISRDQPAGARPLTEPGAFARDAESGAWQVRLYPDEGQRQKLTITLAD